MHWRDTLRIRLKERGYTYASIGAELDLTESAIGHYLKGRREPPIKTLRKLAEMAGMSLNDLFEDEGKYLVVDNDEVRLIEKLRDLSPEQKHLAWELISQFPSAKKPAQTAVPKKKKT